MRLLGPGVDHAGDYAARLPPELRRTLDGIGKLDEFQRLDWMVRFLGQIRPFVNLKKFLRAHAADQGWRVAHNGPWQMTCTTPSGHRLVEVLVDDCAFLHVLQ